MEKIMTEEEYYNNLAKEEMLIQKENEKARKMEETLFDESNTKDFHSDNVIEVECNFNEKTIIKKGIELDS